MAEYRCAIIGCGRIASTLDEDPRRKNISTHAGAYHKNPQTVITCAADINQERLEEFGRKWDVKNLYSSYGGLFRKEKPDLVSICTHNDTHLEIVKAAVNNGTKALLCEKPMALTINEADEMAEICRKSNILLSVCHIRRWYPGVLKAKELIQKGEIGKIQSIFLVYCAGIANQGLHLFDTLIYLLNDFPEKVAAVHKISDFSNGDKNLGGILWFKNNVPCYITAVSRSNYTLEEIHLLGTKGKIILDNMSSRVHLYKAESSLRFSNYSELFLKEKHELSEGLRMEAVLENVLSAIAQRERLVCSGEEAKMSLSIVSGFLESFQKKQTIEFKARDLNIKIPSP